MKKIATLIAAFTTLGTLAGYAQVVNTTGVPYKVPADKPFKKHVKGRTQTRTTAYHARLSHTDEVYLFYGEDATFDLFVDPIFVDSLPIISSGATGDRHVSTMKGAAIFDPKSELFETDRLNPWTSYTVDTVWIAGYYDKVINDTINDTLQLELVWGAATNSAIFQGLQLTGPPLQVFKGIKNTASAQHGNKVFASAPAANKRILKHVLTPNDTITDPAINPHFPYIPFVPATPITVSGGHIVGAQFTFVPGYAYGDTTIYRSFSGGSPAEVNSFSALLYEEIGLSATNPGNDYFYDATSWGLSGSLGDRGRYGMYPSSQSFLNGVTLPYMNDGYLVDFSISATLTSVNETSANGVSVKQNQPNPFSETTSIQVTLKDASDITCTVYDLTGKKVLEVIEAGKSAGTHTLTIDGSSLNNGVYFYTVNAGGVKTTKKMTVVR